jgi:hypothetical protein
MKDNSAVGVGVGPHHRVTKTRAKSAGPTKMTRSLLGTMDVRRRNFECAMAALERSGTANVARIVLSDSWQRSGCFSNAVWSRDDVRGVSHVGEIPYSIALRL